MVDTSETVILKYHLKTRTLDGTVLGEKFSADAVSGGGANASRTDPDLSQNPDLTVVKAVRLSHGVGHGQPNTYEDVVTVQRMLNAVVAPSPGLRPDGRCGPQTVRAIEAFQRSIGLAHPDGWISPGGKTYKALLERSRHYSYTKYVFAPLVVTDPDAVAGTLESVRVSDRGGPAPVGQYVLQVSANTPSGRISMVPQFKTNRTGLQIHASGPVGSDGCIVMTNATQLQTLRAAVTQVATGSATLEVVE